MSRSKLYMVVVSENDDFFGAQISLSYHTSLADANRAATDKFFEYFINNSDGLFEEFFKIRNTPEARGLNHTKIVQSFGVSPLILKQKDLGEWTHTTGGNSSLLTGRELEFIKNMVIRYKNAGDDDFDNKRKANILIDVITYDYNVTYIVQQ